MKKLLILMFLLLIPYVFAQDLQIIKEANNSISLNDNVNVKITFNNPNNLLTDFEIKEVLPQGVILINPSKADNYEYHDGLLSSIYSWQVTLKPNGIARITYTINPQNLGTYGLKPTTILDKLNNKEYSSNSVEFTVYCKSNNICEENENSLNCPEDCKTGLKDNICNYKSDSICDEDCTDDPDCKSSKNYNSFIIISIMIVIILIIYFSIKKK